MACHLDANFLGYCDNSTASEILKCKTDLLLTNALIFEKNYLVSFIIMFSDQLSTHSVYDKHNVYMLFAQNITNNYIINNV